MPPVPAALHELVTRLAELPASPEEGVAIRWREWRLAPVGGGRNNRVYHATCECADVAVKFTIRDTRDRAGREYGALQALAEAGLDIAPRPLLLERDRYPTPVVVMTWLDGTVGADPPTADEDWRRLMGHLAAIQTVTPETCRVPLSEAVLARRSAAEVIARVRSHIDLIPGAARPPALDRLLERLEDHSFATWPSPPISLCRGDPNITNVVRRPGPWGSVDWENSGWGDPAFEIAELIAHAAYLGVPAERWSWVRWHYASLNPDPGVAERIDVYVTLLYAFWAGRFARMLYEIPLGRDVRLTPWPDGWLATVEARYAHYLDAAFRALA